MEPPSGLKAGLSGRCFEWIIWNLRGVEGMTVIIQKKILQNNTSNHQCRDHDYGELPQEVCGMAPVINIPYWIES